MSYATSTTKHAIPVMPIHKGTFTGTATDEHRKNRTVVSAIDDNVDITFTFDDMTSLTITVDKNIPYGLSYDVVSVSSTGNIILS